HRSLPMTIVADQPPLGRAAVPFAPLPWHDQHPQRRAIAEFLGPDHLACRIDQAVARCDLTPLVAVYHGTGSLPHAPDRLLCVALYEMHLGHHSPATW